MLHGKPTRPAQSVNCTSGVDWVPFSSIWLPRNQILNVAPPLKIDSHDGRSAT